MTEPQWILNEIVVSVHRLLIAEHGGIAEIRDQGLLESALAKPRQLFSYKSQSTLFELAAAYAFGLARNHPFVDGSKRIALSVAAIFLELNSFSLDASEPEAVIILEQLAGGNISESNLARWFSDSSISLQN